MIFAQRVSKNFITKLTAICKELGIDPDYLMACIAFETGETFSPAVRNGAGSGAVGLIQFMPQTAALLGTSIEALSKMIPEEQLDYVRKYFLPYKGKLKTLSDLYMAILWPGAIGKPESYVLFNISDLKHPKRYVQNKGLDYNRDGLITKAEASKKVHDKYIRGQAYA